jgi:peptidoglycan hydrolase-like protein with peptidoglycan-binding domain
MRASGRPQQYLKAAGGCAGRMVAEVRQKRLAMYSNVWRAGLAAITILLSTLQTAAVAAGCMVHLAQNVGKGASEPNQAPATGASAPLLANSPEQIRKAQTELRRLDCLTGRVDGKLGDQTREAVKKFWAMAKQPAAEISVTDELIANLAERGDNFCRPPRRFFGFGGRALPPLSIPGARPGPVPPATAHSPSPELTH